MRIGSSIVLSFVLTVLLVSAASAAKPPLSAKDLATLDRVSSPRLSPDGRRLAYVVRRTDWAANRGALALEVLDLDHPDAKPITLIQDERGALDPQWSPDGEWLFVLSVKSGSQQLWKLRPDGSARQQLTNLPTSISGFKVDPTRGAIYVVAGAFPDCATMACSKALSEDEAKSIGRGTLITAGPVRYGESYDNNRTSLGLFKVDQTNDSPVRDAHRVARSFASDIGLSSDAAAISKDGKTLYFIAWDPAHAKGDEGSRNLYAVSTDGEAPRRIAGEVGHSISGLALSPDGAKLAFLTASGSVWAFGRTTVVVFDLASGQSKELTPGSDLLFGQLTWTADSRSLLATAEEQGEGPLYRIDATNGRLTKLVGDGTVTDVAVAGGSIAYLRDSFRSPQQIFLLKGAAKPQQLTHAGADVLDQRSLSDAEPFSFAGWNGETVHGYLFKPYGYVEGGRYPVAFLIHGGPQQSFDNSWSYRWNPQVWAGQGYAVVMINFHGSTGYGSAFGRASIGHWGDRPLEDLQKGWSFALSKYPFLDGGRACAIGGSYGGYMINWIASQWNSPWRCLVAHAGIFDVPFTRRSMRINAFIDQQFGGAPSQADLERSSPSTYAAQWKVPMLVTHGEVDYLVPIDQGISAYNTARNLGIPTEMLVFPDEGHLILKPQNSVQWYQVVNDWLTRWTAVEPGHGQ